MKTTCTSDRARECHASETATGSSRDFNGSEEGRGQDGKTVKDDLGIQTNRLARYTDGPNPNRFDG